MKAQTDTQVSRHYAGLMTGLSIGSTESIQQRPTVLVVEDEEALRELIEIVLNKHGFNVLLAESAESAVAMIARLGRAVDVLLTDLTLPSMDGCALAETLSSHGQVRHIIFMSGLAEGMPPDEAGHGAHYLQKPFPMPALARLMREVLGSEPV